MADVFDQVWDLDSLFPGGSRSTEFQAFLDHLSCELTAFRQAIEQFPPPATSDDAMRWLTLLEQSQVLAARVGEAVAFTHCLVAQDMADQQAKVLNHQVKQLNAGFVSALAALDHHLVGMPEDVWQELLGDERLSTVGYLLQERRRQASERLAPELEELIGTLSVTGYHAWGDLYTAALAQMHFPVTLGGQQVTLTVNQAANKLLAPEREAREAVIGPWEEAWNKQAGLFATALNNLGGFRTSVYRKRGWSSFLREPLELNRISPETLNTMWSVVSQRKGALLRYLERKASLLGLEQLGWYDVSAPLPLAPRQTVTFDEAVRFIFEQLGARLPRMETFARKAFKNRWVEAGNRPGKNVGGFWIPFPASGESRIFMTFGGTWSNVSTLAHELGHAYHYEMMGGLPPMARESSLSTAEIGSTFAEMLVAQGAYAAAATAAERTAILEEKIQRAVTYLMNVHARYLFECEFYTRQQRGPLAPAELNELMVTMQRQAYGDALSSYHPTFWASKGHFYFTRYPFYNFPYTVGYLFSAGLYQRSLTDGMGFADAYDALLRDCGRMSLETLADRHLGTDLTRPGFWHGAIDTIEEDIHAFLATTAPVSVQ